MTPSPELKQRVFAAVRARPSRTRREAQLVSLAVLAGGAGVLALLFWALGGLTLGDRPLPFVVGTTAAWVVTAVAATWLALGRGGRMSGRPTGALIATAIAAPALLLGALSAWNLVYRPEACPAGVSAFGSACHELIVAMSAVMFTAFAVIRRAADAVHPKSSGAALGVAAASWAGLVLNLRCTCATPLHVTLGHIAPLAVAALAGVVLGRWLLRPVRDA